MSAQRALWGAVPASLRSVSLEVRGHTIVFLAVFEPGASESDRELLSDAAAAVIADFSAPWTIEERYVDVAPPAKSPRLELLVFKRAEREDPS